MPEPVVSRHVLPAFLLRRFADGAEQVMAERRDRSRRLALSVSQAVDEAGSYAAPPAVARLASEVEARAARIIPAMVEGDFPPAAEDRAYLAVFLAFQLVVARSHRAAAAQTAVVLDQVIVASLDDVLEDEEAASAEPRLAPEPDAAPPARTLSPVPWLARLLAGRTWQLLRFPGRQLLTGDTPVVLWSRSGTTKPYQHGLAAAAEARFPLDPAHALIVARHAPSGEIVRVLDARHARALNRTVAEATHTWMYYHPESDPMEGVELPRPDDD